MKALITGASSGIGEAFAEKLSEMGCDLIISSRRIDKLENLSKKLKTNVEIIVCDLSEISQCFELYEKVKSYDIDILINNAGFGVFGAFDSTDLKRELSMLNVNIDAVHILTKLFLNDFIKRDKGYILNVASSAAFFPGPLFSSYYASKAYVLRLSVAISEELNRNKRNVYVSALCPGPVATEFNEIANANGFSAKPLSAKFVADYAIKKMFRKKTIIIPGLTMKLTNYLGGLLPITMQAKLAYYFQRKKK